MKKCGRMFGGNICCGGGRCVTCNAGVIGSIDLPGTHISSGELALHLQAQPQPPFADNCDAVFPHLTRNATYIARKDYHRPSNTYSESVFIEYLFWKRLRHPISYRNSNLENNLVTLALHSFFFCFSVAQFSAFVFSQGEINPGFMTTKCGQDYSILILNSHLHFTPVHPKMVAPSWEIVDRD